MVKEFINSIPETNFLPASLKSNTSAQKNEKITPISNSLLTQIKQFTKEPNNSKIFLVTIALLYFYRLNNYKNLSLAYSDENRRKACTDKTILLSDYVPITSNFYSNMTFNEALQAVSKSFDKISQNETFSKDIFYRYPELNEANHLMDISISFIDKENPTQCEFKSPVSLYFFEDYSGFKVQHQAQNFESILSNHHLEKINSHLLNLLEDAINNPEKKLYELSFLGSDEKSALMNTWNNTQSKFDETEPLHRYFEKQTLKTPNAITAVFEENSLTYSELNKKANMLARQLREQGIKPNQLVGICLNRGLEMVVSILGILKSGGAYLPLDPNYPQSRINYMINDSQCHGLIMDKESIKLKGYDKPILEISSILSQESSSTENLENINRPSDLAYVIYTSGTTGNPKGVAIPHKAICNHMLWMKENFDFQDKDTFLQKTPFSFDASVWEFFMPLFIGSALIIAPNYAHTSPEQMIKLVQKHQVSIIQLVPSMLKELILNDSFRKCTSLSHIFCGGEVLTPDTINSFFKINIKDAKLHNLYGPTECTIDAVTHTCLRNDGIKDISLIGRPISNTKIYVLDSQLQLVPPGITGELYIEGEGLAQGYLNNPKATKEKFIQCPFGKSTRNRMYKTGDLVKWNAYGILEYHGRCDSQIKIRGYRVELNEIECAIDKLPFTHQCIVVPEINQNGLKFLTAYIVLNKDTEADVSNIRTQLNKILPEYMIPSRFYEVDQLLTTPGGKIDRKNIPSPVKQLGIGQQGREPRNNIEYELQKLWCASLKIEHIGIDDDFFSMGGNSLSAMEIISSIKEKLNINMSIRSIFEFPTIYTLAAAMKEIRDNVSTQPAVANESTFPILPIKKEGNNPPLFLVHPIGGSIFWYKGLAKYLDKNQPLYGIHDPGLDKQDFIFNNLQEMASYYIKAMQTIQPKGPYLIGGASFGSTVAVEMAKQLKEQDEIVSAIFSLDGWAYYPSLQNDEIYFQEKMKEQNARILKKYMENNIANAQFLLDLQWHREQMLTKYKLPIIETQFLLFKAKKLSEIFQYEADLNWWESYTKNAIELYITPGDHESMFSAPNVEILAEKIGDAINKVLARFNNFTNITEDSLIESTSS